MWLILAGCPTIEGFDRRFVKTQCERFGECAGGLFPSLFSRDGECRDELDSAQEATSTCMAQHCAFQHDEAAACLVDVEDAPCSTILDASAYTACTLVWGECDGSESECWGDSSGG